MNSILLHFGTTTTGLGVIGAKFKDISKCQIIVSDYWSNDDNHQANILLKQKKRYFITNSLKKKRIEIPISDFLDLNYSAPIKKLFETDVTLFVAIDFSHEFSKDFLEKFLRFFDHRIATNVFSPVVFIGYNIQSGPTEDEWTDLSQYYSYYFDAKNHTLFHTNNVLSSFASSINVVKEEVIVLSEDFAYWLVDCRLIKNIQKHHLIEDFLKGLQTTSDGEVYTSYVQLKFVLDAILHIVCLFSLKINQPLIKDFLSDEILNKNFVDDLSKELCLVYSLEHERYKKEIEAFENILRSRDMNIFKVLEFFEDRGLMYPYMARITKLIKLDSLNKYPYEKVKILHDFARAFYPRHWDES